MKRVILCLLSAAALAGCAATGKIQSDDTDVEKALAIERAALHNGVQVIWVHYPVRTLRAAN